MIDLQLKNDIAIQKADAQAKVTRIKANAEGTVHLFYVG